MISLIASMSVSLKLEIIRGESGGASADHWLLQMANGKNLTLAEVAAICLQEDLFTEILAEGMVSASQQFAESAWNEVLQKPWPHIDVLCNHVALCWLCVHDGIHWSPEDPGSCEELEQAVDASMAEEMKSSLCICVQHIPVLAACAKSCPLPCAWTFAWNLIEVIFLHWNAALSLCNEWVYWVFSMFSVNNYVAQHIIMHIA